MEPLSHLDKKTRVALEGLIQDLTFSFKDNIVSIYLYGSAAGKAYLSDRSNLNILILLKKTDIQSLRDISKLYKKRARFGVVAPLVLTLDYIKASTDVFPIEFLDIKESSLLLKGEDVLKDIRINISHLREQCEREIKGQLVRMRGTFLEVEGDQKGMERLAVTAVSHLIFSLKNILRLIGQNMPEDGEAAIRESSKALNVDCSSFIAAWKIKKGAGKAPVDEMYGILAGYMSALDDMACRIDAMKLEGRL